ncbi:hypothetical protein ACJDU8_22555 [Clostridium sp. WILCCON 0269]|uniref:Transposase n=1 Tax=Candidatus Clostridium eludens TaxID=3381663 RepID=A0ABW8STA3_9CLOT
MRGKEFVELQRENKKLRELLKEGIQLMEVCVEQAKHWESMYNQLNRYCRFKYND